jgi:protein-tyrosine phosphatase
MLRVRARLNSAVERGVLTLGWLRADRLPQWQECARLVFVCSGNICRSPYAQEVARRHGLAAVSCGTHTNNGLPADSSAVREAAQRGVDLAAHRTMRWQNLQIDKGDVILTMQLQHALAVLPRARAESSPVVMFSSLLPDFRTIRDPYGKPPEEFREVFDLIDAGIARIARLQALQAVAVR